MKPREIPPLSKGNPKFFKNPKETYKDHLEIIGSISDIGSKPPKKEKKSGPTLKEILNKMGFKNYSQYLDSDKWKQIRREVFKYKSNKCSCCKKFAECIHHTRYDEDTMSGSNFKNLIPLCNRCHKNIEFTNGKKNSLNKANHLLNKKLKKKRT
jgi:hypothetical protein